MGEKQAALRSRELEYMVCGCILSSRQGAVQCIGQLGEEDFSGEDTKLIFSAAKELLENSQEISLASAAARISKWGLYSEGVKEGLITAYGCFSTEAYTKKYIDEMLEMRYRRQVVAFAKKISQEAFQNPDVEKLKAAVGEIPAAGENQREKDTAQILSEAVDRVAKRFGSGDSLLPGRETGFINLDKITGGMKEGELILLTAEPNVGKSLFAFQTAIFTAKKGRNAVYFNYEMNEGQIGDRMLAMGLPFDIDKIKYPKEFLTQEDKGILRNPKIQEIFKEHLFIYSNTGRNLSQIEIRLKELMLKGKKPDFVAVDYLQMMEGPGQSERERLEYLSRGLKDLARRYECPVLCISSLNKEGTTRGSRQIDYDADQIWHMAREHNHKSKVARSMTKLKITKNRDGGKGTADFYFLEKILCFIPAGQESGGI